MSVHLKRMLLVPNDRGAKVGCHDKAVGGNYVGGWYCFGEYDVVVIADVRNNESMTAISLAFAARKPLN